MNDDTAHGPPAVPGDPDPTSDDGDQDLRRVARLLRDEPVDVDPDRRRRTIERALAAADAAPGGPPAARLRQLAVAAVVVLVAGVGALVASDPGGDGADTAEETADAAGTADDAGTSSAAQPSTTVAPAAPAAPEEGGGSAPADEGLATAPDLSARSAAAGDLGEFEDVASLLDALDGFEDRAEAALPGPATDPCPGAGRRHLGTALLTDRSSPLRVSVAVLDEGATIVVLDPDSCEEIARRES